MEAAWPGEHVPLGATWDGEGTNFSVFSANADWVELVLFEEDGSHRSFELAERTDLHWHGYVHGVGPGSLYAFRVYGRYDPSSGNRFNSAKLLLDPYAKAIAGGLQWGPEVYGYQRGQGEEDIRSDLDSAPCLPRCVVIDPAFPWGDDQRPNTAWADTVIYEAHGGAGGDVGGDEHEQMVAPTPSGGPDRNGARVATWSRT